MDVAGLQKRLITLGQDPGPADGILGARTYAALLAHVAGRRLDDRGRALGAGAAAHFNAYGVTTPLRLAHWIGQMAHESGGFLYLQELGGPSYFFKMYDKDGSRPQVAAKLGNVEPGDGARYCGRGIIQLTGRTNYRVTGARIGLDLEDQPDLAAEPDTAVLIACDYWRQKDINALADRDDIVAVTEAINGGTNGLDDRRKYTQRAKDALL
ncbi:glycoside hydrolase family 19 protein [Sphingosinicella sp. BN140058]|uniref:glycoside hydrolase family 19 protein n=1 Tax=Sphingosinicella sp. BN140058 TaxID=1892855 RepID=UPI001010D5B8|nr:glycoside hydrolase family 19 protein [Sphingosinicella sp. BN140058]QAY75696.1 glycoside hydrolase [Sphingosinicella sp. BN140058]